MDHLARRQGRFVTVLPRSRSEDAEFREWILSHTPPWEEVWNRPHPRRRDGPRDIWRVFRYHLPSREVWPVIWVWSTLLAQHQDQTRRARLARVEQELEALQRTLAGPRPRRRTRQAVEEHVRRLLDRFQVKRYHRVDILDAPEYRYRQEHRGRSSRRTDASPKSKSASPNSKRCMRSRRSSSRTRAGSKPSSSCTSWRYSCKR